MAWLPTLSPLLFVFLWSTGFLGAKFGLPYAEPLTFLAIRYVLVLLLMLAVIWAMRTPWPKDWRQIGHIAVAGIMIQAFYLGGVFTAISHGLPAGITALIVGMQPLLTAFGAGLWLRERITQAQWLGLLLGFIGISLVVSSKLGGTAALPGEQVLPMLLPAFIALFAITGGTLYQKRFCPHFDLRTGAVIQFLPSLILTALLASQIETQQVTWSGEFIFALAWLVFGLSLGAISLLHLLIRWGSAVKVASLFYLTPPTTAVLAWLLFNETLTPWAILGMAIAVTGVWLAHRKVLA